MTEKDLEILFLNNRIRWVATLVCVLGCLSCVTVNAAEQPIYRCIENGKTVFTDKPCASTTKPEARPNGPQPEILPGARVSPEPTDYSDPYGDWRGQTQFQATIKGQRVAEAHSVVNMTISIDRQGKIVGASPDNGCKLLGIAAPSAPRTVLSLDVSFSGCRYAAFNRRFSGTLAIYLRDKHAQLSLQSLASFGAGQFDIKATMRR